MSHDILGIRAAGDWLGQRASRNPLQAALDVDGQRVSYRELDGAVSRLANALAAELEIRPGEIVAGLFDNGRELPELLWALRRVGAVLLPLNHRQTPEELAFILRDAAPYCLIHGSGERALQARAVAGALGSLPLLSWSGGELNRGDDLSSPELSCARVQSADVMALVYTSGTSGRPKGVLLPAEAFYANAEASAQVLGAQAEDRWLVCMPLFHVGGLSILSRSVLAGSCAVVQSGFDAPAVSHALDHAGITGVSLVPTMLERLLAERGTRPLPSSVRFVLLGGGAAAPSLLTRARALAYPVAPTYGLTEACSQVATLAPDEFSARPVSGLRALPGTSIRLIDPSGRTVPPGSEGEICIAGPTLMCGYWQRERETAAALQDGWLHTGDIGHMDAEGGLWVLDRRDDLIVSGGENIAPAEVEAVLQSHAQIAEAAVVARPDPEFGARPVAFFVSEAQAEVESAALKAFCRKRLAGYKVPVAYHPLPVLPRTASGKLLRRLLRESTQGQFKPDS